MAGHRQEEKVSIPDSPNFRSHSRKCPNIMNSTNLANFPSTTQSHVPQQFSHPSLNSLAPHHSTVQPPITQQLNNTSLLYNETQPPLPKHIYPLHSKNKYLVNYLSPTQPPLSLNSLATHPSTTQPPFLHLCSHLSPYNLATFLQLFSQLPYPMSHCCQNYLQSSFPQLLKIIYF